MPRIVKTNRRHIPKLAEPNRDIMIKLPGNLDKLLKILPDESAPGNSLFEIQLKDL